MLFVNRFGQFFFALFVCVCVLLFLCLAVCRGAWPPVRPCLRGALKLPDSEETFLVLVGTTYLGFGVAYFKAFSLNGTIMK